MPVPLRSKVEWQAAWQSRETLTTTLLAMLIDTYGTEALGWDPATIAMEIEQDFNVALPRISHDRLMVGIQLLTSDAFYKSLPDFISFCNVLSGTPFDPVNWDPADALEIAWGITEGLLLAPPDENDDAPFNTEICAYIAAVLDEEGIMNPPDVLRIALRNPNLAANVQGEFSNDADMFQAVYEFEAGKTGDINRGIRQMLKMLLDQLGALKLATGSTRDLLKSLPAAG